MDFENLIAFAQHSANSFYDTFNGSPMLEALFTPFAEAITDFINSISFIDFPAEFTEMWAIIFGDTSLATIAFSFIPVTVIFLAVISFVLDILL